MLNVQHSKLENGSVCDLHFFQLYNNVYEHVKSVARKSLFMIQGDRLDLCWNESVL